MEKPCVAILLATYNGEKYLSCQLDSLLNQSYKNIRIVVADDFSSDNTVSIIDEYAKKDSRIKVLDCKEKRGGAQENFMFLLKNTVSDYYMFCDQDDVWLEKKVEITLEKMLKTQADKPCLVHSDLTVVDSNLEEIAKSFFDFQGLSRFSSIEKALVQNSVTGCTVMLNNALRDLAIRLENTKDTIMHDWFLAVLASAAGKVGFIDRPLILYRQHGNNQVGAKNASGIGYISSRAVDGGNRQRLYNTFIQAKKLAEVYGEELGGSYAVISDYGKNTERGKLGRIKCCARHGIWKNSFIRKIGQLLFL